MKQEFTKYIDAILDQHKNFSDVPKHYYSEYNVKRGLRNADGTGVLAGLTSVGEVHGYVLDEGNKAPIEGTLRYRGISIKDIVENCDKEGRYGFEEVVFLLMFGSLPTKEELETTLSIITTSYTRDGNIISAVQENLPYIKPPLKESFTAFVGDAMAVSSSVKQALYNLKGKVDDEIFREWVDTLIQCQDNQEMKDTLQPIVSKLTDVRIVNNELNTMMSAVRTEYYTMVGLVVGNIPLLYVLNKDWFHTLIFETPGKIVLGVCGIVIVVTYFFFINQYAIIFHRVIDFKYMIFFYSFNYFVLKFDILTCFSR